MALVQLISQTHRILETEKYGKCHGFSGRSHVEEEDKMGRSNSLRPGLSLSSQSQAFLQGLIPFKMSLGKADSLEDQWDKRLLYWFFYRHITNYHNLPA